MPNKPLVSGDGLLPAVAVPSGDVPPPPSIVELAVAARDCTPLAQTRRLATWVDAGRSVTRAGVLAAPAAAEAIQVLGLRPPHDDPELDARQGAMFRVPERDTGDQARRSTELSKVWDLALDVGFLTVHDDTVRPGPAMARWPGGDDAAVLEVWTAALASATRRAYDHEPVRLPERLCLGTLPALDPLYGTESVALADLRSELSRRAAREGLTEELRAWTERFGDALSPLLTCLSDFGALSLCGDRASLTSLGAWAWRTLAAEA